jgi:hypothetical protein
VAISTPTLVSAGSLTTNLTDYGTLFSSAYTGGRLYVLFLSVSETGGAVDTTPAPTTSGLTWAQIDAGEASTDTLGLAAFRCSPSTNLGSTATALDGLSVQHEGVKWALVEIDTGADESADNGADAIANYDATSSGTTPGTSYSQVMSPAPAASSLVIAGIAFNDNAASTPDATWSELVDGLTTAHINPSSALTVVYDETTPGTTPGASWTNSVRRRVIGIEVREGTAVVAATVPELVDTFHSDADSATYAVTRDYTAGSLYFCLVFAHDTLNGLVATLLAPTDSTVTGADQTWDLIGSTSNFAGGYLAAAWRFAPTVDLAGVTTTWTAPATVTAEGFHGFIVEMVDGLWRTGGTNGEEAIGEVEGDGVTTATKLDLWNLDGWTASTKIGVFGHANANLHTQSDADWIELEDVAGASPARAAGVAYHVAQDVGTNDTTWTTGAHGASVAFEVYPPPLEGAVAFNAVGNLETNEPSSIYLLHAEGLKDGACYLLAVGALDAEVAQIPSLDGLELPWAMLREVTGAHSGLSVWMGQGSPVDGDLTITFASAQGGCLAALVEAVNVGATPIVQSVEEPVGIDTPAAGLNVNLVTFADEIYNGGYAVLLRETDTELLTWDAAAWSKLYDMALADPASALTVIVARAGGAHTDPTFTWSGLVLANRRAVALEVDAGDGGTGGGDIGSGGAGPADDISQYFAGSEIEYPEVTDA